MFEALANWLIYDLAGMRGTALSAAAHFFVMDVTKILVLLTLVIYIMGLLRALISPERVREFVRRRSNVAARFMAVGLGAVTPFCSRSSIPLFIGFVEAGIPLGVTISFLIASPMVNEVAVVVLASVIGVNMTAIYALRRAVTACQRGHDVAKAKGVAVQLEKERNALRQQLQESQARTAELREQNQLLKMQLSTS